MKISRYPNDLAPQAPDFLVGTDEATGKTYSYPISSLADLLGGGGGGTDDQTASEVPFTPTGNTAATDVQAAIEELQSDIDNFDPSINASEVPFTPTGNTAATDVQAAIEELQSDIDGRALSNHTHSEFTVTQITWANLVALGTRKNGDRFNLTDRKDTSFPNPMGYITLQSATTFNYTHPTGIVEIVTII